MPEKITIKDILSFKNERKITMLTAYDYPIAYALEKAGIDIILVGDSVANVVLGLESTKEVGMVEMIHHAKAVSRAVKNALLVGDMPFEAYQEDVAVSVCNARRFITEAKCDAVKLEWFDKAIESAKMIIDAGIPVMGHIGLTPQTADKLGGFKVQGKDAAAAKRLIQQAKELEQAGCFSILLECVPDRVSEIITKTVRVPTIGIGAGPYCDGQVLVTHDMLGLFERYSPKFVKKYVDLTQAMTKAFSEYKADVIEGRFPLKEHSFTIKDEELKKLD
ncbi:MAG: 3-methyl-2-oxobutanoate hydroxymethyltransferase [Candidatus Omnitrophica bacterium CG1_02_44_16]|nr:MAG: 3-methyl-2-oxobutanoate hydroxymethyltransferase [Candidatus Omnitrophica bacterium CG1_02_44_16]PIY82139.1 MAG: 3-methyl-2-oxobutanoate hydroxymethyltransferase [Candidatus Omnitrophica bacterium CG_4_10_14_0_8_um_filter_44_12]